MAGVTDAAFRNRLRRNGCRYLFTEMVSAAGLVRRNRRTRAFLEPPDRGPDLAIQLFGSRPGELAAAASEAVEAGFRHVDLNMGCPVRKVVRSGAGAALMMDPGRAGRCLEALRRVVPGTLSVKIRAGWDASTVCAPGIARMAAECGVDLVILHPRTRAQGYSGRADWGLVALVAEDAPVPVVGNGDVRSAPEALERLRDSGCAGVMIGRAALAEPWIFRDCERLAAGDEPLPRPSPAAVGRDLAAQLEDMVRYKGERRAVVEMRKFAAWASRGMPGATSFRRRVQALEGAVVLERAIRAFFDRAGAGCSEEVAA